MSDSLDRAPGSGDRSDIFIAIAMSGAILVALTVISIWWATAIGTASRTFVLLSLLGGISMGWATGILMSPYNPNEEKQFARIAKVGYAFITGYALAKLDPLVTSGVEGIRTSGFSQAGVLYLVVGAISFLSVVTATYVTRKYW